MPTQKITLLTVSYGFVVSSRALRWGDENSETHQYGELAFTAGVRYQIRMSDKSIEDLAHRLADSLPDSLRAIRDDAEANFRSILKGGLEKLDLVTREEFEVQEAVLQRTREKLEALAERLKELEED